MAKLSPRAVVGTFAGLRLAIGVVFAVAPARLTGQRGGPPGALLMTRSFAVREVTLGVGGLLAAKRADLTPSVARTWAGLGALTDAGDLAASLAGGRRDRSGTLPAVVAVCGLVAELWAFSSRHRPVP